MSVDSHSFSRFFCFSILSLRECEMVVFIARMSQLFSCFLNALLLYPVFTNAAFDLGFGNDDDLCHYVSVSNTAVLLILKRRTDCIAT